MDDRFNPPESYSYAYETAVWINSLFWKQQEYPDSRAPRWKQTCVADIMHLVAEYNSTNKTKKCGGLGYYEYLKITFHEFLFKNCHTDRLAECESKRVHGVFEYRIVKSDEGDHHAVVFPRERVEPHSNHPLVCALL